ncbi:DUF5817 domain-containing protein [Halodesulfurarchaeum sp.]|uniref:DUF5817 domain-containing protein n=1 Tax=Halodesulfurarchaeum sp. TaxID=1980530 RepID=UPI002FC28664
MAMYAVVGCSNCQALWIVEDRPETTSCPRCGQRHEFERLKQFVRTESQDEAREVRAAMLASAQDRADAYEDLDSVGVMAEQIDSVGVDDEAYLSEHGLDPDAIEAAGTSQNRGPSSQRDRILDAIDTLDEPTETAVVEYASERGVPPDRVRSALEKLAREGTIVQDETGYRRL